MPTPNPRESEDEFIARCMGDDEAMRDFPDSEQRLAFCYSTWEESEKATYRGEEIDLVPTQAMAEEAERGLKWRQEFNRGGTEVGVARARDLANRRELSADTVRRMVSYFARHEIDKEAEGFSEGEEGYPSAGRIAWALWGGDPGQDWANRKAEELDRIDQSKNGLLIMEKKLIKFDSCQLKSADYGVFEGYASVFNGLDSYNDTILPGAYRKSLEQNKNVAMLFNHAAFRPDMPAKIGKWLSMEEDQRGLYVKGQLALGHPTADAVYASMKNGTIDGLSIGYSVPPDGAEFRDNVRYLKEIDLFEISVVDFPADNAARISMDSVKSSIESLKTIRDVERFLKESGNLSNQSAKALLARIKSVIREELKADIEKAEHIKRLSNILKGI